MNDRVSGLSFRRGDKVLGTLSGAVESARRKTDVHRDLKVECDLLLNQAAAFARGGDFMGAQARARFADQRAVLVSAALHADDPFVIATRAHLDAQMRHYDSLVRTWRTEVEARQLTYVTREQRLEPAPLSPSAVAARVPGSNAQS